MTTHEIFVGGPGSGKTYELNAVATANHGDDIIRVQADKASAVFIRSLAKRASSDRLTRIFIDDVYVGIDDRTITAIRVLLATAEPGVIVYVAAERWSEVSTTAWLHRASTA